MEALRLRTLLKWKFDPVGGNWGASFRRIFGFLSFFIVALGFYGVHIIPKWLIKVPGTYCNTF